MSIFVDYRVIVVTKLESLPNIGPRLAADLCEVGIPDAETLRKVGADEANRRLGDAGLHSCLSARKSIEGAVTGTRWPHK